MTSVDSNFKCLCGRPHGTGPPPPVHMRPPEPDPLPPPCGRHKWMAPILTVPYLALLALLFTVLSFCYLCSLLLILIYLLLTELSLAHLLSSPPCNAHFLILIPKVLHALFHSLFSHQPHRFPRLLLYIASVYIQSSCTLLYIKAKRS